MFTVVAASDGDEGAASEASPGHVTTQLSALLADLARAEEVELPQVIPPGLKPGDEVGRFRLIRELGRGGFGVVYEALDGDLSRTVALKVVRPGTRIAARGTQWLLREAEAVARLNHPNIVTLHDIGQGPGGPYLVFELLRGRTLSDRLRDGTLPVDLVLEVSLAVARALVHAHAAGVIHRDLTAANIHLGEDGAVKVLDFGLAHLFGQSGANGGGTPAYMAPEQWEGDRAEPRSDLFALGVILFQALAGQYPYKVEKGWSEALEPGETPCLPRQAGPRGLRRLVRSLLEREPLQRPESARAVRDQLLSLRRSREGTHGKRVLWGLGGVAAAFVLLSGWLYAHHEPPPGEVVNVVMAALEGAGGDPALEAVPGLLAATLEPSQRVKVVPPEKLASVARQSGMEEPVKVDAEAGRSLARLAGAAVVLVPAVRREGGKPWVEVRAIESEGGKVLFLAKAAYGGRGGLSDAVDSLSDRIRRELKERAADRALRRPVAEAVTASPEAAGAYYQGIDCLARRSSALGTARQCVPHFERALSFDPTFPLAHYQLARAGFLPGDSGEEARPHLQAALDGIGRLPEREAKLLRALSERIDGRPREALKLYDELLLTSPDDAEVLALASEVEVESGDWPLAAGYLEREVAVVPDQEYPVLVLIEALGRQGEAQKLEALLNRVRAARPLRWRAVVEASLWLGERDAALKAARSAVAERGDAELSTLCYVLKALGEYGELEKVARRSLKAQPSSASASRDLEFALIGQGRIIEALRYSEANEAQRTSSSVPMLALRRAMFVAATRDPARVWPYAARALALDRSGADLAVVLALLGDLPHADRLAKDLAPGSNAEVQYRALRSLRTGDASTARALLQGLEAKEQWPIDGLAPSYLLAEVSAEEGDDAATLSAISRFDRLPADRIWRAWAYPRLLYLSAAAHLRLGDKDLAREGLDRLLTILSRGDRTFLLLAQARSLKRAL